MTMRIAILAACASTLTLAAATGAFAQSTPNPIPGVNILYGQKAGAGTAQPSISDQGAAGNLSNYRSRQKVQGGLPGHKTSRTFLDGNASVGTRGVRVQAGDYDGDGRAEFRTRGRNSSATVRGIRTEKPSAAGTTRGSGTLRFEAIGNSLRK